MYAASAVRMCIACRETSKQLHTLRTRGLQHKLALRRSAVGYGVFAVEGILPDVVLGEYAGELLQASVHACAGWKAAGYPIARACQSSIDPAPWESCRMCSAGGAS